jgi:hypothetical protein
MRLTKAAEGISKSNKIYRLSARIYCLPGSATARALDSSRESFPRRLSAAALAAASRRIRQRMSLVVV